MKGRAFAAVVLSALLLLSGLGIGGWWLLWQRGPLQLAHHRLTLPRAARFVPASASFSLYLFSDGQRPVDYARAVAPARQRRPAGEAIARLRDGAFAAAGLDYQDELAGWLGGDIAMALFEDPVAAAAAAPAEPPPSGWLLALASRDDDGARRFLQRFWQTRSLAGTDLQVSRYRGMGLISGRGALVGSRPEPLATALVDDDLVLIASGRNLLERALDVSQIPELNQAGQPLLRQGVAAFGSGAALAVASPQVLQSWLGLPAAEPAEAAATPVALSEAAAAARGLPRLAALAATLPDPPVSGTGLAEPPAGASPSVPQSSAAASDGADAAAAGDAASDGRGPKLRSAAPAGDAQLPDRSGALGQGPDAASESASAAPGAAASSSPAPVLQPEERAEGPQRAPRQEAAGRSTPAGVAPQSLGAPVQSPSPAPVAPVAGADPAAASPPPQRRPAGASASRPAPSASPSPASAAPSTASQVPAAQAPAAPQRASQEPAAKAPAAPPAPAAASPSPSGSPAAPSPTGAAPASPSPALQQTAQPSAEPAASPARPNAAAAPSLLAVLQPQGRQLELRARLLLPDAPRLIPLQPDLAEALLTALRGSPTSLALIQDPAALARQPLLRPLLQRSLGLRPQAQAERQGPLPALLARSIHGPLLASQAAEGWQLATRPGDPAAVELAPLLSQAGLLEAPLALDGHSLRVWTRLSPPVRSGRSGRMGADALVAPLAGWSEPRQELAWWGQTLASLDAPAETRALTALRQGLRELAAPQAPLQWSLDGDAARVLLRTWQPWRLLSALAGGGLDGPVRGLALAVDSPADVAGLELRARLSLGA